MRRLVIPISLFLSAWAHPTGPVFEATSTEPAGGITVIDKKPPALAALGTSVSLPAETTAQVLTEDGDGAENDATQSAAPEPIPVRLPPRRAIPHAIVCEALASAAADNDLPAPFFIRLIWQESGFNQNAISPAGAQGVAQFMPAVAARMQLTDPFDPLTALRSSAQLLRDLFERFGNLGLAAAAYNAGPKRVDDWLARRGKLPQETRDYVQRVTGLAPEKWKAKPAAAQMRVPAQVPCQRQAGLFAANGPSRIPLPPHAPAATTETASIEPARHPHRTASGRQLAAGKPHVKSAHASPKPPKGKVVRVALSTGERHK